ncbi:protein phosphatase 2C domain-containing protein [Rhodopirellula sp. P2]|uniref:protein phosphatase 2C domain-containing protein n=1 Tax=Rhodopirellula sp. P2 TaxID=2127060 RepID=UPI0023688B1A|nr:protein phosphatase 2C domain-containing protein [Rhodopirellula sp. P2]WDQ17018.1 protein phosphatase 2C domain-containing protein [Rhodopirellula sp. P2]|tara:strand:- start:28340 stop:29176 length:837 start_codon:yes stop_codon:yes gene_type:complete
MESPLLESLSDTISANSDALAERGTVLESPGFLETGKSVLSVASDHGNKETNRDSFLAFVPLGDGDIKWAVAIADGVSASFESKLGSRLACYASVAALVRTEDQKQRSPISECAETFLAIGERILGDARLCRPDQVPESHWTRFVQAGRLFQTTVMIAWQAGDQIFLDGIGDGGFVRDFDRGCVPMMYLPSSSGPVTCLGAMTNVAEPQYRHQFASANQLYLFTDGVTGSIERDCSQAIDVMRRCVDRDRCTVATDLLQFSIRSGASDDNQTLAVISP